MDDLPIPHDNEERKLFVLCEMKVGETINANIFYTGNTSTIQSEPLIDYENYTFAIAEGEADFGVDFKFDGREINWFITKARLPLKQGMRYKFRGVGTSDNYIEPIVTIPSPINIANVSIKRVDSTIIDGKHYTKVKCNIKLDTKYDENTYFYITPTSENGTQGNSTFEKDFQAYKNLSHKNGFLVDYERVTNDELEFYFEVEESINTKSINIEFGNVTPSFYQYNYYYSNVVAGLAYQTVNPAIAGFNIVTDKAFGSFSANYSFTKNYIIK